MVFDFIENATYSLQEFKQKFPHLKHRKFSYMGQPSHVDSRFILEEHKFILFTIKRVSDGQEFVCLNVKSFEKYIGEMTHNEKVIFGNIKTEHIHIGTIKGEKYFKVGVEIDTIRENQNKRHALGLGYRKKSGKKYRQKHSEYLNARKREWAKNNKARITEYNRNYANERRKVDINFRFRMNLRNRLRLAIKENNKSAGLIQLIGCSIAELMTYLENKFTKDMNWDNYGSYWVVDHILPCASFDLSKPEEQRKCFHYTNLQPLTAEENSSKGARILSEYLTQ